MFMSVELRTMFALVSLKKETKEVKKILINNRPSNSYTGATATDALSAGYRTILIDDCCRGVDLQDIEATKESVLNSHGVIVHSKEVRHPTLKKIPFVITDCFLSTLSTSHTSYQEHFLKPHQPQKMV